MRKIIAILIIFCFVLSCLPLDVKAESNRAEHIRAEIERHRQAIRNLKSQMKEFEALPPGEGGPPGSRPPRKGRGPGIKDAPGKGEGLRKGKRPEEGRGPGLKGAPGKSKRLRKGSEKGRGTKERMRESKRSGGSRKR